MSGTLLIVNAGSSSLKLAVLDQHDRTEASRHIDGSDPDEWRRGLIALLEESPAVRVAAHRIVHGGPGFRGPVSVDDALLDDFSHLADLAPLHNPPALEALRLTRRVRPALRQVACFDTAFHATIPPEAFTYALPEEWNVRFGLRRFGFHGLSHAYASRRAAELMARAPAGLRIVTAHLGAGASLAAVMGGRSVDTTMGFTPLEGLVMATRSGSVDPGLILWLARQNGFTAEVIEEGLERRSGLAGLAGGTGDMREVTESARRGDTRAILAVDVYLHRLRSAIAAMAASMGGLDGLAFTGGVGQNSTMVRAAVAEHLAFLGVRLEAAANEGAGDRMISPGGSPVAVLVVEAREDLEMARQVRQVLGRV